MALRAKFAETHSGLVKLVSKKLVKTEEVPGPQLEERLKAGWRIENLPKFNFSFRSLLDWAHGANLLPPEANTQWILLLRNSMAHPNRFNWVLPPGDALEVFRVLIRSLMTLWPE